MSDCSARKIMFKVNNKDHKYFLFASHGNINRDRKL